MEAALSLAAMIYFFMKVTCARHFYLYTLRKILKVLAVYNIVCITRHRLDDPNSHTIFLSSFHLSLLVITYHHGRSLVFSLGD